MIRKIALLPGHSSRDGGSVVCAGLYKGKREFALAGAYYLPALADKLRAYGYDTDITTRDVAGGSSPSYSAKAANATGADIALEFHFNSCGNATGSEVLYWGYNKGTGREFAERLGESIAEILGVRHRGALPCYEDDKKHPNERCTDNGWGAFNNSRMPFFMVEPCFAGSNPQEAEVYCRLIESGEWVERVAPAIHAAIRKTYS